eukprot:TRINITY_DN311_c0_g1_i10.p3 TRINITY_DN311_c0_g1~~TRINITY_DN311_c0_g1_i10.p3  ORF type:complete len:100 (+),score=9.15 TRINITY_DN311_c0_g1_i10:168-467(+)
MHAMLLMLAAVAVSAQQVSTLHGDELALAHAERDGRKMANSHAASIQSETDSRKKMLSSDRAAATALPLHSLRRTAARRCRALPAMPLHSLRRTAARRC